VGFGIAQEFVENGASVVLSSSRQMGCGRPRSSANVQSSRVLVYTYASHAYPGMSAAQLSQVSVLGHIASTDNGLAGELPGYPWDQGGLAVNANVQGLGAGLNGGVLVTDGSVAVICSGHRTYSASSNGVYALTQWYDSVRFTLLK
jgi:hypothetical protein